MRITSVSALAIAALLASASAAIAQSDDRAEFAERRARLLKQLEPDGLLILRGGSEADIAQRAEWRQKSDFFYLTGFDEPDAILVLSPGGRRSEILLVRPKDPMKERWDGPRVAPGPEGAEATGVANVMANTEIERLFPALVAEKTRLYCDVEPDKTSAALPPEVEWLKKLRERWSALGQDRTVTVLPAAKLVHPMRLVKSVGEIARFRKACEVTARGLFEAMKSIEPGMNEGEAEALIEYGFRRFGSPRLGFSSIVGSGPNSCVLHYRQNTRQMQAGEMVVLDVGAEWGYYTADITRTVPVNGTFSPAQRELYEIVYRAQEAGIAAAKPGATIGEVHMAAARVIGEAGFAKFFPHSTSHWIGLDVHDVGDYGRKFEPGMIFSVEPGIYIPTGTPGVDEKYWGIGIRIEDDVLITAVGCEVLSAAIPRTVAGIEATMRATGLGNLPCGEPAPPAPAK